MIAKLLYFKSLVLYSLLIATHANISIYHLGPFKIYERFGTPLKDLNIKINYGIKTGCNEAYIIDEQRRKEILNECVSQEEKERTDKIIRPILRGRDITRDGYRWAGLYVILAYYGFHRVAAQLYPAIYKHLASYEHQLKKRGQVRYTSSGKPKIGADYPGQHHWLELDNNPSQEYMDDFSKRKIIWSDIATEPNFIVEDKEIYFNNTCYMITGAPAWLADYLNSDLIAWYFPKVIATDLGSGSRYFKQFIEMMPAPIELDTNNINHEFQLTDDEIKFISSSVKS